MNIEFSFLYHVSTTSPTAVLSQLLRKSEVGILQRVDETTNGFVAAIYVAGDKPSGAIYVYDRLTSAVYIVNMAEFRRDFTQRELNHFVPQIVAMLNPPQQRPAHRRINHRRRSARKNTARVAGNSTRSAAAVSAVA